MIKVWCFILTIFLGLFVASLYFLITHINYYNEFTNYTCPIIKVEYPTYLPLNGYDSSWNKCDCGDDCSSYSPNIKLYSSLNKNVIIKESFADLKYNYTFGSRSCSNGEHIHVLADLINDTINQATQYINTTLNCYANIKKSEIILDDYYNFSSEIIFLVISSILFLGSTLIFVLTNYHKIIRIRENRRIIVIMIDFIFLK